MKNEKYKKSLALRVKDSIRKALKSLGIGGVVYRSCQKLWRSYIIPKRRRNLQKNGAAALARLHALMEKNDVAYYCNYGTLLGFVRENGFLKHDDDIDVTIQWPKTSPSALLKVFLDAGYGFVHAFRYQDKFLEFTVADVSGVTLDIFFPDDIGNGMLKTYEPNWYADRKYPAENANTLMSLVIHGATKRELFRVVGVEVMIPSNYDQILTDVYGNWRIPDAHFKPDELHVREEMPGYTYGMTREEALSFK